MVVLAPTAGASGVLVLVLALVVHTLGLAARIYIQAARR